MRTFSTTRDFSLRNLNFRPQLLLLPPDVSGGAQFINWAGVPRVQTSADKRRWSIFPSMRIPPSRLTPFSTRL